MKIHLESVRRRASLGNQNQGSVKIESNNIQSYSIDLVANIVSECCQLEMEDNLVESDCSMNQSFESEQKMNLSCLTASFVRLFFALRPINNALSLDEAAEHLAPSKAASIKRRLYDIINVLLALDLIEKVQLTFGSGMNTNRKAGYQWKMGHSEPKVELKREIVKTPTKGGSVSIECQTSPSLLKSLIRDITLEMNNSR